MSAAALFFFAGSLSALMASTASPDPAYQWAIMPLVGAMLAAAAACLLNKRMESRKIIFGRVIFALMFGLGVPRVAGKLHPWVENISLDPYILAGFAFTSGMVGFIISVSLVERMYKVAPSVADDIVQEGADRIKRRLGESLAASEIPTKKVDEQ